MECLWQSQRGPGHRVSYEDAQAQAAAIVASFKEAVWLTLADFGELWLVPVAP